MKKLFRTGIVLALFLALTAGGCTQFATLEQPVQNADGVQINNIVLSTNGISMASAYKGKSMQVITASYTPSFASNTAISWTSSNTAVATVTASGAVATVTAQGNGTAIITASNSSGAVKAQCSVICELENVPPLEILNVQSVAKGNNVRFTWTDPDNSDNDLSHILIKTYAGSTFVSDTAIEAGVESGVVKNLSNNTGYTFNFYAVDIDGNKSNVTTASATTTEVVDTVIPEPISGLSASTVGSTITLSWTASPSSNVDHILLTATGSNGSAVPFLQKSVSGATTATFTGLPGNTEYAFQAVAVNSDYYESTAVTCTKATGNIATNLAASICYSDCIKVTWTDPAVSFDKLKITAYAGAAVQSSQDITANAGVAIFTGLTAGTSYTISITTVAAGVTTGVSDSVTGVPAKILWRIYNTYNLAGASDSSYMLVPDIENTTYEVAIGKASERSSQNITYEYWLVVPNIADPFDSTHFSLEALDADKKGTGYYLYLDPSRPLPSSALQYNKWGFKSSGVTYATFVAKKTDSYIKDNLTYAAFKLKSDTKTVNSYICHALEWGNSSSLALYATYLNTFGNTGYSSSNADYFWYISESIVMN